MGRENAGLAEIRYRNKERDRKTEKRWKETEPTHFFHVTVKKLNHGDLLEAGEGEVIFLSGNPLPHATIATERVRPRDWFRQARVESGSWKEEWDRDWNVYEVEPIGQIEYGAEFKEIKAKKVRVIRFVGNAKAMLANQERRAKRRGKTEDNMAYGSLVSGVENVREGKNKVVGHGRRYWDVMAKKSKLKENSQ